MNKAIFRKYDFLCYLTQSCIVIELFIASIRYGEPVWLLQFKILCGWSNFGRSLSNVPR